MTQDNQHNEMPKDTVEELKNEAREYEGPAADFRMEQSVVPLEHVDHLLTTAYNKGVEVGRVEERVKVFNIVKDKLNNCQTAYCEGVLEEIISVLTPLPIAGNNN